ncbi:MAG: UPF0175 family protein [Desulfurococcales archaeon]|nr:UPF0175 family protein [Desulfurococcales archaeon]
MSKDRFIVIRVPRDVVEGARVPEEEFERMARIELAVALYTRGVLSLGQARRLAGLSKWEFLEELARRGVERHYTREELEDDIAFAEE